jgi:hypothetical protein
MKVTNQELKVLINKYQKEGLKKNQITKRIKDLFEFDEYIKFANKYLNKQI